MAQQKSQKPNEAQKTFNAAGSFRMNANGLRRAQQIAGQRQQTPYTRVPVLCVSCGAPRDRRSYPVCDNCTAKRKQGLR